MFLSNRQTLPILIEGILPSLDNLHIVIWCNRKYSATSLVVIISAKMDSPGFPSNIESAGPWKKLDTQGSLHFEFHELPRTFNSNVIVGFLLTGH
jgi:hypothetical protein